MHDLLEVPGFLSFVGVTVGRRMYTLSAWESPEAARAIRADPGHREAVSQMFGPQLASGGQTGIWAPWRLNEPMVRCTACDRMVHASRRLCLRRGTARPASLLTGEPTRGLEPRTPSLRVMCSTS